MAVLLRDPFLLIPVDKESEDNLNYLRERLNKDSNRELVEFALFLLEEVQRKGWEPGRKVYIDCSESQ